MRMEIEELVSIKVIKRIISIYIHTCIYVYIYIYIYKKRPRKVLQL